MNMLKSANNIADELVRIRRDIHAHPELGFQEFRTSALVAETLREIGGIKVEENIGRTGVVGTIGNGDGITVAIRADMDALPITQKSDAAYKSTHNGVMHACGHDAHTAILLGVAHLLRQSSAESNWNGRVKLLFQPSEEIADVDGISGAMAMIADGALADVDVTLALHVNSTAPAGEVSLSDGYSMAAVDVFEGWIRGEGGHGAYPHAGSDPIYMTSHVLNALYAIPSRYINPLEPCVVTVGQVHAGTTSNVIPNVVYLHGTIRSFDPKVRELLWAEVERAFKLAEVFGGSYDFTLHKSYPATFHSAEINQQIAAVTRDLFGDDVIRIEPKAFGMGAEDFAYMTEIAPGAMFMLGASTADGLNRSHHTDIFDIDESVLPIGAAILAETARRIVTA
jgi:amidohydrolase